MLMHARYPSPAADAIPLVMIHGFLGGGDFFTPNIAALAAHRPIISVDLPGFAASHAVAAARSIEAMARQVLATLSAMECAPFSPTRSLHGRHGGAANGAVGARKKSPA